MLAQAKGEQHKSCTRAFIRRCFSPTISLFGQKAKVFPALIKILLEHTTCLSLCSGIKLSILTTLKPVVHKLFIIIVENYVPNHFIACSVQFTCVPFFFSFLWGLRLGVSSVASTPCQYPCLPALRDTLAKTYTQHRAAGRRQLCSLKGKVNSCACDSWSSHDIPSPNIRDGFGHNGESAERVHSQPQTKRQDLARNQAKLGIFFFS